jgi:hypothetical protein
MGERVQSSGKYTEAQMRYFDQLAKEEQAFELSSAFEKGTKVVDITTGKITVVK